MENGQICKCKTTSIFFENGRQPEKKILNRRRPQKYFLNGRRHQLFLEMEEKIIFLLLT